MTSTILSICREDPRYDPEAYLFVREALTYTVKQRQQHQEGGRRHVSGQELSAGFRDYALEQFGPMTFSVLKAWGINRTEDIGTIVFHLVHAGELGKTQEDKPEDFANGYDFHETFETPFLPPAQQNGAET